MGDRAAFIVRVPHNRIDEVYHALEAQVRYLNKDLIQVGLLFGWDKALRPGGVLEDLRALLCGIEGLELVCISELGNTEDDFLCLSVDPQLGRRSL